MNAIVLTDPCKTSERRRSAPVIPHICDYCLGYFIGVRQKKYCNKSCTEAAFRARKSALIDALTIEFAPYGMKREHVERCAHLFLERCQDVAAALGLQYFERKRAWLYKSSTFSISAVW